MITNKREMWPELMVHALNGLNNGIMDGTGISRREMHNNYAYNNVFRKENDLPEGAIQQVLDVREKRRKYQATLGKKESFTQGEIVVPANFKNPPPGVFGKLLPKGEVPHVVLESKNKELKLKNICTGQIIFRDISDVTKISYNEFLSLLQAGLQLKNDSKRAHFEKLVDNAHEQVKDLAEKEPEGDKILDDNKDDENGDEIETDMDYGQEILYKNK